MKNYITLALLFMAFTGCKAQTVDLSEFGNVTSLTADRTGMYYKDIQSLLDPFVGTYIYTNGNTSFKIVLQKKLHSSMNNVYYRDLIIGEYQYIENGVEKVNTLNDLNIDYPYAIGYGIYGNFVIKQGVPGCRDCAIGERGLWITLTDKSVKEVADLFIRHTIVNGQPAIKATVHWTMGLGHLAGTPPSPNPSLPGGEYILIKQP